MDFEIRCVDHHGLLFAMSGGQTGDHPGKDALVAPMVVEGLMRAVFRRRIAPPQAIAIDEGYPAQDAPFARHPASTGRSYHSSIFDR